MSKIRSRPRDANGKDLRYRCQDPKAVELAGCNVVRKCKYVTVGGRDCRRRWGGDRKPQVPCPIRREHMITVEG